MAEPVYIMLGGLSDKEPSRDITFGPETYNVYPDDEGYLVNYPGKSDYFYRPAGDPPANLGVPPSTSTKITRLITFRDRYNQEHIVFVQGATLCVVVDNGFELLYTFVGIDYSGRYFPELFIHEGLLVVLNFGDPPLLWDGYKKVHPLGVHETPMSPDVRVQYSPGSTHATDYGYWQWYTSWWPGVRPQSSPAANKDADSAAIKGVYQCRVQFIDQYGNRGRPGPASRLWTIKPKITVTAPSAGAANFEAVQYACIDWSPPKVEDHIYGVEIGRTANLHVDDPQGGRGAYDLFYTEKVQDANYPTRFVHQISDTMLMAGSTIDLTVLPPSQCSIGASWAGRILIAGLENPAEVRWSDSGKFGQFRAIQSHMAKDHITAIVPVEGGPQTRQYSRVIIVTRSTVETLYDAGSAVGLLNQNFAVGSRYGRSIVSVDGGVFGLWNRGFGLYNGETFTFVEAPYFLKGKYMDDRHFVYSARVIGDWYFLSVRKDSSSANNNYMVMYHLKMGKWYIVKETMFDLTVWRESLLGCDDSIFELFKGNYSSDSVVDIDNLMPEKSSMATERSIDDMHFLIEPSTSATASVELKGLSYDENVSNSRAMVLTGSRQRSGLGKNSHTTPVWNQTNLTYAQEPNWNANEDVWVKPQMSKNISGCMHSIKLTLPSGNRVRIKAIRIKFSDDRRAL
tara:strand:- start:28276 stop:30318 length:2043 start_codon:yes stop_codon:yes gene_type:complete